MRFQGWDPGRLRDGMERAFPDRYQDNGFGKQRNGKGDLRREDLTGFRGFNRNSGLLGIDSGLVLGRFMDSISELQLVTSQIFKVKSRKRPMNALRSCLVNMS